MSPTIQVSIYFASEPTIEFDFLSEKLNWTNLVTLIESTRHVDSPVTLYYKKDGVIESLENQLQLDALLSSVSSEIKRLSFYVEKEGVTENVYVLPGQAFARLTQFVEENKEVVSSSHRLGRWVGILASFIAQDTMDHDFDYEFKVLDALVARKTEKIKRRQDQAENPGQQDARETLFGRHAGPHGGPHGRDGPHRGPHGEFFGRGGPHVGPHGEFFGRGRRHHEDLEESSQGESSDESQGRHNHHGRGGPFGRHHGPPIFGPEAFGRHFGGKHGPFGKHGGGRHGPFSEEFGGKHGPFGKHGGGRHGPFGEEFGGKHGPFGKHGGCRHGPFGEEFGGKHGPFGKHGGGRHGPFGEEFGGKHGPFGKHGGGRHGPFGEEFGGKHGPFGKHGGRHHRGGRCGRRGKSSSEESSGEEATLCEKRHGNKQIFII